MCSDIVDSTFSLLSEHFSEFISHLHQQSFPFVLSQGAEELAASRGTRQAFTPFGAPGNSAGGSVFARPAVALAESHIDWSSARLGPVAPLPARSIVKCLPRKEGGHCSRLPSASDGW
jgi:hypothetical protein